MHREELFPVGIRAEWVAGRAENDCPCLRINDGTTGAIASRAGLLRDAEASAGGVGVGAELRELPQVSP